MCSGARIRARYFICVLFCCWLTWGRLVFAVPLPNNVTSQMRYWIDTKGQANLKDVLALVPQTLDVLEKPRAFELPTGALWLRYELPVLDPQHQWYLLMDGPSYTNRTFFYQQDISGQWQIQRAGDRLPMSQWSHPDLEARFRVNPQANSVVWLRLQNFPTSIAPTLKLVHEHALESRRNNALLWIGMYLGFCLLVIFLGWIHARLYGDRVFVAYMGYVACMMGFQTYYNGLGAFFITPELPAWNDLAPVIFVCWLTAFAMWFVREVAALHRHSPACDRFMLSWSVLGFCYPMAYCLFTSPLSFALFNLYALLSILLSLVIFIWAWRRGETFAGWSTLGFLPLYLSYPFPALRAAGILSDMWLTQHAMLMGSAVEIPMLLYILHRRAKDFNENHARMRAVESIDPLTGLTVTPVLLLRVADAIRRAQRHKHHCGLVLVDLANHEEIVAQEGRQIGDRALVTAAAQLTALVHDVDTVCRVDDTRFAILLEGPCLPDKLQALGQHIIAKGLVYAQPLPRHITLRYRLATLALPELSPGAKVIEEIDAPKQLARLGRLLDQLDLKRVIIHAPAQTACAIGARHR